MSHILVTLYGIEKDIVEDILHEATHKHKNEGIHLEHIWQNADNDDEVVFLFQAESKKQAESLLEKIMKKTAEYTPLLEPPKVIYLKK